MSKGIFVTGTGTDVGKTFVTALLLKELHMRGGRHMYFKAAVSGNERDQSGTLIPGDPSYVKKVSGIGQPVETMCLYVYEHAVSPHLAARWEQNKLDKTVVYNQFYHLAKSADTVTVEGAGGILCPLIFEKDESLYTPELIRELGLDCVLVADAGLGTLNSVGLTSYYMKSEGIRLKGIILNQYDPANALHLDNRKMCEEMTGVSVVACVEKGAHRLHADSIDPEKMYSEIRAGSIQ